MKQLLKHKGPDGKWVTVASYEVGQYGPRVGIRKEVARELLQGVGWLNLSVFDHQEDRGQARPAAQPPGPPLDDAIPF